jgi:hypothetical protein
MLSGKTRKRAKNAKEMTTTTAMTRNKRTDEISGSASPKKEITWHNMTGTNRMTFEQDDAIRASGIVIH